MAAALQRSLPCLKPYSECSAARQAGRCCTCACLIVASRVPSSRESVAASAASTTSTTPAHRIHLREPTNPPVSEWAGSGKPCLPTAGNAMRCQPPAHLDSSDRPKAVLTHSRAQPMRCAADRMQRHSRQRQPQPQHCEPKPGWCQRLKGSDFSRGCRGAPRPELSATTHGG
jgi:hypothetical protein